MRNYELFIIVWSINFGAATTSFDLEVFVLQPKVFGIGTGLLFLTIVVSSFVAGATMNVLGPHRGMSYAFLGFVVYLVFLAIAGYAGMCSDWQWPLFLVGAFACGTSVAHLGAGLGPLADRTTAAVCKEIPGSEHVLVSAKVLAIQAIFNNLGQCVTMLALTVLQVLLNVEEEPIILIMAATCLLSMGLLVFSRDPPPAEEDRETPTLWEGIKLLLRYYKDPRAGLLAVYPLALSCMSSWKTAGLSSILKKTIGKQYLGVVMMLQALSTVIFAKLAHLAIDRVGNVAVMGVGALALVAGPALFLFTDLAFEDWWILIFFGIVGIAWAVYETAGRGLLLENFRGQISSVAFASMTMQTFFGGMVFYFLDFFQTPENGMLCNGAGEMIKIASAPAHEHWHMEKPFMAVAQAWIVLLLGVLVMPAVMLAEQYTAKMAKDCPEATKSKDDDEGLEFTGNPQQTLSHGEYLSGQCPSENV